MAIKMTNGTKLICRRLKYYRFVWKMIIAAARGEELPQEKLIEGVMDCFYLAVPLDEVKDETRLLIVREVIRGMAFKGSRKF